MSGDEHAAAARVFVGRERELDELDAGLAGAHGRTFLIAGEPGIGKTTLCEELADRARDRGAHVIWGRAWESGGAPAFWPWVQILRSAARSAGTDVIHADPRRAALLAQMIPELRQSMPELPQVPQRGDEPPDEARFALFDAVALFLGDLARTTPVVIVIEDAHAADLPSLLLLRFIASALRDADCKLVVTYRETDARAVPQIASLLADIARDAVFVPMRGFNESDVAAFVEVRAGARPAEALVRSLHEATDGNPFFIDGCVRLLAAEGTLFDEGARIAIPDGVREAIMRRLGRLSDSANDILGSAAVIGREFDSDLLSRVAKTDRTTTLELLDEPVRAGLVRETARMFGRFVFAHALIRDVLYESMPARRRAEVHLSVAAGIEDAFATDLDPHLAELAHHRSLGGDTDRAVELSERAGQRALDSLAYEDAAGHFTRALDQLERMRGDGTRRARITLALADARGRAGELAAARAAYERAIDLARDAGDAELTADATLALGELDLGGLWVRPWIPDLAWIARLEDALAAIGAEDTVVRARLLAHLGAALYFTTDQPRGADLARQAVEIAERTGDDETLATCLTARHLAAWTTENLDERIDLATRIVRIAGAIGARAMEMQGLIWLYTDRFERGDIEPAKRSLERYVALADELRRPQHRVYSLMSQGMLALFEGRLAEAERLNIECRALAERIGDEGGLVSACMQGLAIARETDRVSEIADVIRFWARRYEDTSPSWRAISAFVAASSGRIDEAARRLPGILPSLWRDDCFLLSNFTQATETCVLTRDTVVANELYDIGAPFEDRYAVGGRNGVIPNGPMHMHLGMLAELLGRRADAERHFAASLQMMRAMGAHPAVARTLVWQARLLIDGSAEERARADVLLGEASALCDAHALTGLRAEIDGLRAPETGLTFVRDDDGWTIGFEGARFHLPDRLGLQYLARLVQQPRIEFRAIDLMAGGETPAVTAGADDMLDDRARREYRRRIDELRHELDEAKEFGDTDRAVRAEDELDALTRQLQAAAGLGGRARKLGAEAERARISVTKAIKGAVERIAERSPTLAAHLQTCIKTGAACSYAPERTG